MKKLENIRVAVKWIITGALGTVPNGLDRWLEELEIGGRAETIQTTVLLRSISILRRVLETIGGLLLLKIQWKTTS